MRLKIVPYSVLFERWSYVVPLLCYVLFFCMIWMLSLPLKPDKQIILKERKAEDIFEANLKNSNFDSEKSVKEIFSNEKNEYLVNVNDKDNKDKNQVEILEDVFRR